MKSMPDAVAATEPNEVGLTRHGIGVTRRAVHVARPSSPDHEQAAVRTREHVAHARTAPAPMSQVGRHRVATGTGVFAAHGRHDATEAP